MLVSLKESEYGEAIKARTGWKGRTQEPIKQIKIVVRPETRKCPTFQPYKMKNISFRWLSFSGQEIKIHSFIHYLKTWCLFNGRIDLIG